MHGSILLSPSSVYVYRSDMKKSHTFACLIGKGMLKLATFIVALLICYLYLNVPNKLNSIWVARMTEILLFYLVNKGNSAENVVDFPLPALNILIQKIKKNYVILYPIFSSQILCSSCFLI